MTESAVWQFAVEVHPANWHFPAENSWIAGWIRPRAGQSITDIRARIHHRVILGLFGLPHPAFTEKLSSDAGQAGAGFSLLLCPQPGATFLSLEACDQSGRWTEFFRTAIFVAQNASAPPSPGLSLSQSLSQLATALIKQHIRHPARAWIDLADELMAAFVAEPLHAYPNAPFVGALEEPHTIGRQRYGLIPVTGWLAHPKTKIARLVAIIDPLPATTLPHGLTRPDNAGVFRDQGGQANSTFVGEVAIPADLATPILLKIFAGLDNGENHLVFARRFIPQLYGATGQMPPLVSGVTYLSAIWALARSARRYSLPRQGLIRAALAAWARYKAIPAYRPKTRSPLLDKIRRRARSEPARPDSTGKNRPTDERLGLYTQPISTVIAPADDMCVPDATQYFHLGQEALTLVQQAVAQAGCRHIGSILDLPCGYGRVARWLRTAYPDARLDVSDTQGPGVAFCIKNLGATGVQAMLDGSHWASLPGPYDIIWCGSLLTHFGRDQWINHLRRFAERLSPDGVLVFTTHGLPALDKLQTGEKDYGLPLAAIARLCTSAVAEGFGYVDYPDTPGYGISVSQPAWLLDLIAEETALHVLDIRVSAWDQHQDAVICTRRAKTRSNEPGHNFPSTTATPVNGNM